MYLRGKCGKDVAANPLPQPLPRAARGRGVQAKREPGRGLPVTYTEFVPKAYLTRLARENRRAQTPAEAILWEALRRKNFAAIKFKRQKPIGRYIADFCAPSAKLIIELDGSVHDSTDARAYDAVRTSFLEAAGYRVLRFGNQVVLEDLASVLGVIAGVVHTSSS